VNGDGYGVGAIGVVIKNGVLYSGETIKNVDVGVIYKDGTMKVFEPGEFDADKAMEDGAFQAWYFGPGLLTEDGEAKTTFNSNVKPENPRTVLGYYEPGHYCFIVVDGRPPYPKNGYTMEQLSKLCEKMELPAAYNLDGGQTST
jgi:exopolysaccharide biosynthesis protein